MPYKDPIKQKEANRRWQIQNRKRARELQVKWRANNRERSNQNTYESKARNPEKEAARQKINKRVQKGLLPQANVFLCADCNAPAQEYHHDNYEQWWAIICMCKLCHERRHHVN